MSSASASAIASACACAFSDDLLRENYAWVDVQLEENYCKYSCDEDIDICRDYDTFGSYVEEEDVDSDAIQLEDLDSDFRMLVRDIQDIILYHQDRRRRRGLNANDVFQFMTNDSCDY